MKSEQAGVYALLIGALMFILIRAYVHYKGGFAFAQDALTWTQDIAAILLGVGLVISYRRLV
jgi:hypothetical protein